MLSDDVFKVRRRATVTELEAWVANLRTDASVYLDADEAHWHLAMRPDIPEACALELVIRHDQHYDVRIAGELYEDQPIDTLDLFLPLLRAVTAGDVVTRVYTTAATGVALRVESIVGQESGGLLPWRRTRDLLPAANALLADALILSDRHYAPYARGA